MQKWSAAIAIVALASLGQSACGQAQPPVTKKALQIAAKNGGMSWQSDVQSALQLAGQQNKLVFIDIGAEW